MAYQPLTQDQINNAIKLNRVAGESYDQGTPMSMAQAIDLASQYGAVPSRISSGAADPSTGYSGIWAIPTANGWVPLDKLAGSAVSSADMYHGGPAPQNMVATQQRSTSDVLRPPYGPSASTVQAPPPIMGTMDQWRGPMQQSPTTGYNAPSSYPPSTSGPGPSSMSNPDYPGSPSFRPPAQPQASSQPVVNVNITPSSNQNGSYDPSGWYNSTPQFSLNADQQAYRDSVYNGTAQPRQQPPVSQGPSSWGGHPDVLGRVNGYGPQAGLTGPTYGPPMWNQVIPNFTGNQTTPYTPTSPDLNKSYTQDFGSMPPIKPYTPPASMGPTPSGMYPNQGGDFSLQNQMYRWGQMLGLVK